MAAKYKPRFEVVADAESLALRSLSIFIDAAKQAISEKDRFHVAISGGHTPARFFELLGDQPESVDLPWDKIHLFWVDERIVPPDSADSNYNLAVKTFLPKVPVPEDNVHRIPTEYTDFNACAYAYEQTIREVFALEEEQLPLFDLIILGMGPDGHTGSLFPDSLAPFDTVDLACVVYAMDQKLARITLTHPVLSAASQLVVLVSGGEKAQIVKKVFTSEPDEVKYPIHILWPILDKITWILDNDAARLL